MGVKLQSAERSREVWRRWRTWWHEPHFLQKNTVIGGLLMVAELIIMPPSSPTQMMLALGWLAFVAVLPLAPRLLCVLGSVACLMLSFLPQQEWWTLGGTALITLFLAAGYALPRWATIAMPVGYSVLDAVGCGWFGFQSLGGGMVRGAIDAFNDIDGEGAAAAHADAVLPQYWLIVFVSTLVLDLMVLGFVTILGAAFRRTAEADERANRTELLLGRVTREQELAHMIHDSVANDMSTIAMLAWRAKTVDDDAGMLDAMYARSHHALDRVHEVIDVLNGKRNLDELGVGTASFPSSHDAGSPTVHPGHGPEASFDTQLEKYVEDQDRMMAMLGFVGVSRLNSVPNPQVPAQVRQAAMRFMEEVYANIVRHCAMDVRADDHEADSNMTGASSLAGPEEPTYSLFVDMNGRRIRISEVNAIADESRTMVRGRRHGGGIALHRAAIESLGGTLNASQQDGTWTLSAEIPY